MWTKKEIQLLRVEMRALEDFTARLVNLAYGEPPTVYGRVNEFNQVLEMHANINGKKVLNVAVNCGATSVLWSIKSLIKAIEKGIK